MILLVTVLTWLIGSVSPLDYKLHEKRDALLLSNVHPSGFGNSGYLTVG